MYRVLERNMLVLLLLLLAAMFGYFAITWEGFYGGADNIAHYRISRYSFEYPHLFLDHWGKPLFTLLSAPFSQFGFTGIRLFNVSAGLLAALFTWLTAKKLELKNSLLVVIFTLFSPIYFVLLPTGLTEILFSLVLILSVYLFFNGNYFWSAILVSFLPFARTEGIVIIPLFFLSFLYVRKFFPIIFLFTGSLIYSVAGFFQYGDLLWLIHQNPYTGAKDIYGSGDLFHFVRTINQTTGLPLAIIMTLGVVFLVIESIGQKISSDRKRNQLFLFLIGGGFIIYMAAHSYAWWKGLGGSLGLVRVMAGVIPLATLLGLKGYNSFTTVLRFPVILKSIVSLGLITLIVYYPLKKYRDFPLGEDEKTVKEAATWLKGTDYYYGKVYYYHLFFIHFLERNPFDQEIASEKLPVVEYPSRDIPVGSIVQWDSHFGPNEGRMPLERLQNDPGLELMKVFEPKTPLKTWKGDDFVVYIFHRIDESMIKTKLMD